MPNGRLAMCQAMVRRNWRVVIRHGSPDGPGGSAGCSSLAEQRVQVIAVGVELADDLCGDVALCGGPTREHRPECVEPARVCGPTSQPLKDGDRLGHGRDRHPLLGFAAGRLGLVGGRAHPIAHDEAVFAAGDRQAATAHRLHLAVAHAGEVSADDVAGRLEHPLLGHQGLRVEARPPRSAALRVDADGRVHAADLEAKLGDGASIRSMRRRRAGCACWARLRRRRQHAGEADAR